MYIAGKVERLFNYSMFLMSYVDRVTINYIM